ncbi:hypothetical protein [Roseibium sp.]|uniref:hypothetical protein n=1 Tax=Roseibium sp. TaxID=1936156 RepID=UPI003A978621
MAVNFKYVSPLALGIGMLFSSQALAAGCIGEVDAVQARLDAMPIEQKTTEEQPEQVTVEANGDEVTIPAIDAKPTESWFGMPPGEASVEEYLEAARLAAKEGDEEACMENLENARTALESR